MYGQEQSSSPGAWVTDGGCGLLPEEATEFLRPKGRKKIREENQMKTVKDKYVLVGADIAGYPLKEAVVAHLKKKGWTVEDVGVQDPNDPNPEMFHRIGIKVGTKIAEREYERAIIFCGTGMGIHIAASKCPHVHAACCESVPSALRCITGNNCNVLSMGGHYVAPQMGIEMADAFLEHNMGDGYDGGRTSMSSTSWPMTNWKPLTMRSTRRTASR